MGLFDGLDSAGWGGLLTSVVQAGVGIHQSRLAAQQQRRLARRGGGTLAQMPGWGGSSPALGISMGDVAESVLGGETVFGTPTPYQQYLDESALEAGGRYDRCGRMVPPGHRVDACGNIVPVRKGPPSSIEVEVTDERDGKTKTLTYLHRGRPVLFAQDLSAVKRVQRVAASCARALGGGTTRSKRRSSSKRRRGKRRKVACRTLTAKQLAAGFGGAQYRR